MKYDNDSWHELKRAIKKGESSYDIFTKNKIINTSVFTHSRNHGEEDAISILFEDEKIDNNYYDKLGEREEKWEIYLFPDGTWKIS